MWIKVEGGQKMGLIIKSYNIIIKSANLDERGGGMEGKTLIYKLLMKIRVF